LALYGSNVISELQRASIVPQILAQDPEVIWRYAPLIFPISRRGFLVLSRKLEPSR
jgi:hypothetical protein